MNSNRCLMPLCLIAMPEKKERDVTTVTVPRQLMRDFDDLPDDERKKYLNFSDFGRVAIRYYLERQRRAAKFGFTEIPPDSEE